MKQNVTVHCIDIDTYIDDCMEGSSNIIRIYMMFGEGMEFLAGASGQHNRITS